MSTSASQVSLVTETLSAEQQTLLHVARRGRRPRQHTLRAVLRQVGLLALVLPPAILFLIPWAWMLSTAGKSGDLIWKIPPVWIPPVYHWEHFPEAWQRGDFGIYFRNTVFICALSVIGVLLSSSLAAFAFSRIRFPGRRALFLVVLSTMMLPAQVTMIPLYIVYSKLGWVNSFRPLIVPLYFGDAFSIFLLRQFFMTISRELDDAALIDGCSRFGVFLRILLPLTAPALAVVGIFQFMWSWNEYMGPLIYLSSPHLYTITLGLTRFMGRTRVDIQYLMAMTFVSTLIPLAVFFVAQRHFIQGIVVTGVKG